MKPLLIALVFVMLASPVWGVERTNPPTDKPGPTIPVSTPRDGDVRGNVQLSVGWWVAYAGYLEVGPFASLHTCGIALRRFPLRYRCIAIRD